jgi:hypothetical protein
MKSSPRPSLLFILRRSFLSFGAVLGAVLAFDSALLAATPVDIYQSMESGNAGDALTATIMNASSHGSTWSASSGALWVATKYVRNLPGPVTVGGVTYNGTGSTRTWKYNNNNMQNFVSANVSSSGYTNVTIACYYTTEYTVGYNYNYDTIVLFGANYCVLQERDDWVPTGPYLRAHCGYNGNANVGPDIKITAGKTYWVNLNWNGGPTNTGASVAVFDPDNGFAQVGTSFTSASPGGPLGNWNIMFGRQDSHGNNTADTSQSYMDHICIDYTNHVFPLIPSSGTDTTPPSAPPTVRDGTGADISTTSSTTQLSANWDASTDNESGISGYQYAIGTSAGGTQTVNWTSLGNVTTVTKTGLTLTVGQTYYFSVKAVNGAGLTGSATNSNGQTVVGVTPTVYFQDNFENWTVHGGAWSSVSGENSTQALNTSTDYAMAGAKSLKLTDNDSTSVGACLVKTFSPAISGNLYVRFFVYLPTGFTSANTGCAYRRLLRVWCGTNRGQFSLAAATPLMEEVGAWGASMASSALSENTWHCVEMYMAAPSASTAMQYWIDGTSAGTLNGSFGSSSTYDKIEFGNASLGGGANVNGTYYLDELIVSNAYIDPSAPSAPATVRDGTGADISTTSSTTQLSANWDAGTDADSGISGYQYAIGTSAGGTQTVNWTSLGNVTTVTSSGLSLTVGQTYFVSVRSVNGAGLNSGGTSSNGQTAAASATTYFSDNFENWTVHGGAWSSVNGESSNHTLNTSTDYARAGSKSLKITDTDSTGTTGASLTKNFSPVISGDIYVRFYVFLPTGYTSANANCARRVLRVWCGSNRGQLTLTSNQFSMQEVGGWTGTGSTTLSENAWHCIEMHITAPSASTAMQYWVDGTSAGTVTGTFSGSSTFDHMELGDVLLATGTTNGDGTIYWDEVIVSNAYNGPLP